MPILQAQYREPRTAPKEVVHRSWTLLRDATNLYREERRAARGRLAKRLRRAYSYLKHRAGREAAAAAQIVCDRQLAELTKQWSEVVDTLRTEYTTLACLAVREVVADQVMHPLALRRRITLALNSEAGQVDPILRLHPLDSEAVMRAFPDLLRRVAVKEDASIARGTVAVGVTGGEIVINWQTHLDRICSFIEEMSHTMEQSSP